MHICIFARGEQTFSLYPVAGVPPMRADQEDPQMKATIARTGLVLTATVLALTGCTEVEQALNQGGDTPCRDYVEQDQDKKRTTITKFVKEQTGDDQEPSGTSIDATMVSVDMLCGAQANADTPIKNADVAGIFVRK